MKSLSSLLASDEKITLVLQGGGMRGVYGMGVLRELQRLGYPSSRFKEIIGTSAGALNGSYFLTGQVDEGISIYTDYLSGDRFINFRRRDKILDIDYLVDDVIFSDLPIDEESFHHSSTPFYVSLAGSDGGLYLRQPRKEDLRETLRAAAAMPIFYGREIKIGERYYLDGGVIESVSTTSALERGAENILVILTREEANYGAMNSFTKALASFLAKRKGHSRAIIDWIKEDDTSVQKTEDLLLKSFNIWTLRPSKETVSRLTRKRDDLIAAAEIASFDTRKSLLR